MIGASIQKLVLYTSLFHKKTIVIHKNRGFPSIYVLVINTEQGYIDLLVEMWFLWRRLFLSTYLFISHETSTLSLDKTLLRLYR